MKRATTSGSMTSSNGRSRKGRPFGETSYSGKGLMTKYTKPAGSGGMTMGIPGKKASSNGAKNMTGRSGSKTYVHDPNVHHKSN